MALEINWTKRAENKFDKIIEYLLIEWGKTAAKAYIRKVYGLLDILSDFPEIGILVNKEKGIRGVTIVKQINLFYRISGNKIILLNFFDNRQNPKNKRF